MKRILIGIAALVVVIAIGGGLYLQYLSGSRDDPAFFEREIQAFEKSDEENAPAPGGIVFVGSSSIRFWSTLDEDMAPLRVLNRGFGGAHFSHVLHNAERIVIPYAPRAVVVYVGDNDIGAGKSVEEVVTAYQEFVDLIHAKLPETAIYYLPIKPSKLRWKLWPEMSWANAEIEAIAARDPRLHYLDVATPLLDARGEPRDDVFLLDGLHMNATGYAAWTEVVAPALRSAFGR